ncbi:MAG TPA: ATP-binding protein [Spirochaetota bacterium]|nr:ATP-binding protein [Spirochaetota bacterium]HOM38172.1 ATP-binding protein [Spirochaetota bacterium]HPQ48610.1 ATP-binding protein [Spirochaetota bacterium]
MNNKVSLQLIFVFSIFIIVLSWSLSWIINARTDYYKILENISKEFFVLKKNDFLNNITSNKKDLLHSEKEHIEKTFFYIKEINFFISETKEYIKRKFKESYLEITIKENLTLEKIYPLYLNNKFLGNIHLILEDKIIKDSLYISIIFLILICISFISLGYHIIKTFNLEDIIKEKKSEINKNISYIIHELKNPITAINNIAYLLKDKENNKDKELVEKIKKLTEELNEKVSYIINITKVDFNIMREKTERINLYNFISTIIDKLLYIKVDQIIKIENKIDKSINLNIPVDILEIIMDNIISNSIKYTEDGEIIIETRILDKDLEIIITDTGIGIPEKDREKVFDIFYRSSNIKNNIKGSGVGLALVKKAIDYLKWEIKIESPVFNNKGTKVIIKIPFYTRFLN